MQLQENHVDKDKVHAARDPIGLIPRTFVPPKGSGHHGPSLPQCPTPEGAQTRERGLQNQMSWGLRDLRDLPHARVPAYKLEIKTPTL